MASAQSNHGYWQPSVTDMFTYCVEVQTAVSHEPRHMLVYTDTQTHISLDSVYSLSLNITSPWHLPGLNPTQSYSNIFVPSILTCPWLTCDIYYEADCVFAHAGAGIQAWILWRDITNLQHLLLYQRAVVGTQRAAIFGPGDGLRCWQGAAQLQHLTWVHWAHRGLRNLVFIRCVCRVNGEGNIWGRGCIRRRKEIEVGDEETSHRLRKKTTIIMDALGFNVERAI